MNAVRLLTEAKAAGVVLRVENGAIRMSANAAPPPDLLVRLRAAKPELTAFLRGDCCNRCGQRMAWPGPAGVIFADGTAECCSCTDAEIARLYAAARRVVLGVVTVSDEGELLRAGCEP